MGIREVFIKAQKLFGDSESRAKPKGLTAEEVELKFFLERERLDNVKKVLAKYRKKDNQELLIGKPMERGSSILKKENNPKYPKILSKKNTLISNNTLLKGKKILRHGDSLL